MSAIETTDSLCLANGPTQKILETGKSDSYFGSSVAVSNNTIVIGTINGKTNAGAAYVYTKDGDDWEQRAKLIASDVMKDDRFGWSVAINSAGDTVVVGAYFEESSKPGAAYIFKRAGSYWNQVAKLAGDKSSGDEFGAAVAIDDDTIVVGASEDESNNRGGAYVFTFNGSKWNRSAKITAPSTAVAFGAAVDIQGSRIVVSDPYNDKKTSDAGAVHVYSRSGSEWTKEVALSASDAQEYDYFGARASVALDGDTIAVGASGDDNTKGDDAGSVYIFDRLSSGSWKQTSKLTASDGTDYNYFGWSVALQNNVLVVGSFQAEKVYIYARSGSTWELKNTLINPNGSGEFGAAVALDGTAVIAGDASANDGAGRVTIYELC